MSVISRSALESSTLADLHEIASELGLDGFRRLRKGQLVDAIVDRQGTNGDAPEPVEGLRRRRAGGRRGHRGQAGAPLAPRRPWPGPRA